MFKFKNLFKSLSDVKITQEEKSKIETLRAFCSAKFQSVFGFDKETAKRYSNAKVKEWLLTGQIDSRLKQMWTARI